MKEVKGRVKKKPVNFKTKNKEIARRQIIEWETEIKSRTVIKTIESKLEILREITEKKSRKLNTEKKNQKKN